MRVDLVLRGGICCSLVVAAAACSALPNTNPENLFSGDHRATVDIADRVGNSPIDCASSPRLPATNGRLPSDYETFWYTAYCAYHVNNSTALSSFVAEGISLSDRLCDAWFNALETRRVESEFNQGNTNIAAGGVVTVMGIAEAAAKSIGIVGAGASAANAFFENYQSNYILTPEIALLQNKIHELRQPKATQMKVANFNSYGDAKAALQGYDSLCSRQNVLRILNESPNLVTFQYEPDVLPADRARALVLIDGIAATVNKDLAAERRLTIDNFPSLWLALFDPDPERQKFLRSEEPIATWIAKLDAVSAANVGAAGQLLGYSVSAPEIARLRAAIDAVRASTPAGTERLLSRRRLPPNIFEPGTADLGPILSFDYRIIPR